MFLSSEMVRNYKRKAGNRSYKQYSELAVLESVKDIENGLSSWEASQKHGVPYRTIQNKNKRKHTNKYGGQMALGSQEEAGLASTILIAAEWGYPLTKLDIRLIVKSFLEENNKTCERFKDNMPGIDWCAGFIKRHPELTIRKCQNVKRARASIKIEEFEDYFDNLEVSLEGVKPEDIVNYDETNATDDPGEEKVVVKKAAKHADRIMDSTKTSTSLMFSGTAAGKLLPVYVVYKALNMFEAWTEGGPPDTVYNRTKSGWFDTTTFEDWFFKVALKYFRSRPPENKKVLIGDNCSSHLSVKVIKSCMENNIKFIFLPKNSTHLSQPLDIAWFKSFKYVWKQQLAKWKAKYSGVLPKSQFPRMLASALKALGAKSSVNLKSGFRGSGIHPLNRNQILKQLPQHKYRETTTEPAVSFNDVLVSKLTETRYPQQKERKRNTVLPIKAGQSVTNEETIKILEEKLAKKQKIVKTPRESRKPRNLMNQVI